MKKFLVILLCIIAIPQIANCQNDSLPQIVHGKDTLTALSDHQVLLILLDYYNSDKVKELLENAYVRIGVLDSIVEYKSIETRLLQNNIGALKLQILVRSDEVFFVRSQLEKMEKKYLRERKWRQIFLTTSVTLFVSTVILTIISVL